MPSEMSPLMRLPVDIRLHIYELTFADSRVHVHEDSDWVGKHLVITKHWTRAPGLLLTSKQVYQDAIGIYYSETIFVVRKYTWTSWAKKLTTVPWQRMRSFHLDIRDGSKPPEQRQHSYFCEHQKSPAEAAELLAERTAGLQRQLDASGISLKKGVLRLVHHDCDCVQWIWGRVSENGR